MPRGQLDDLPETARLVRETDPFDRRRAARPDVHEDRRETPLGHAVDQAAGNEDPAGLGRVGEADDERPRGRRVGPDRGDVDVPVAAALALRIRSRAIRFAKGSSSLFFNQSRVA